MANETETETVQVEVPTPTGKLIPRGWFVGLNLFVIATATKSDVENLETFLKDKRLTGAAYRKYPSGTVKGFFLMKPDIVNKPSGDEFMESFPFNIDRLYYFEVLNILKTKFTTFRMTKRMILRTLKDEWTERGGTIWDLGCK